MGDLVENTNSASVNAAGAVMETDYGPNSILFATVDDTPIILTVEEQRIVGRVTSGNITDLTAAEVLSILTGQAVNPFDWNSQNVSGINTLTVNAGANITGDVTVTKTADNATVFLTSISSTITEASRIVGRREKLDGTAV